MGEMTTLVVRLWVDAHRSWAEIFWEEGGGWDAARAEDVGSGVLAVVLKV